MDPLEKQLTILVQNGKMCGPKLTDIAKKVGKSPATVYRKLKEMEKKGVIKEYVAHMDPEKLGKNITTFVWLQIEYPHGKKTTHEEFLDEYMTYFKNLKEVQEIYIPLGKWDLILKVKTEDIKDQYRFISEKLMPLGNVRRMESLVMMKTIKERTYIDPQ